MNDLLTKETRGRYMSTLGGVARTAAIVGPFLGGILASDDYLRKPFYGQALLSLINAVLMAGIMLWVSQQTNANMAETAQAEDIASLLHDAETGPQSDGPQLKIARQSSSLSTISSIDSMTWRDVATIHGPALGKLAVFSFCINVTRESRHLLFPLQAMGMGHEARDIGLMTSITFLMDSVMFPMAGYLMDHHGRKYAGVPALLIMGISLASVPLLMDVFPSSMATLTVASAGCGVGNGLSSGLLMSMAGDMSPVKGQDRAKFFALFRTCADAGLLFGPWISGMLAEHWSLNAGFEVVAGVAFIGALWMAFIVTN
jgi:MFS family permease